MICPYFTVFSASPGVHRGPGGCLLVWDEAGVARGHMGCVFGSYGQCFQIFSQGLWHFLHILGCKGVCTGVLMAACGGVGFWGEV